MLKSKTLGITLIGAFTLAVAVGAYSYLSAQTTNLQTPSEQTVNDFPKRPSISLGMYEKTTTLAEAEKIAGYKINIPSIIPEGQVIQLVKIRPEQKAVRVFIAPMALNDSMTLDEVMARGGVLILYDPLEPGFNPDSWMNTWVTQYGASYVTVHGAKAIGHDRDPQRGIWAEVYWFENGLQKTVVADRPLAELLRIVESIPSQ